MRFDVAYQLGVLHADEFAWRKLPELASLYMLKRDVRRYLLNEYAPTHKFPLADILKIREAFQDTKTVTNRLVKIPGAPLTDTFWKTFLCEASQKFCNLLEEICFTTNLDGPIKAGRDNGREARAIVEYQAMKDETERILEILEKELVATGTMAAPTSEQQGVLTQQRFPRKFGLGAASRM